MYMTYTKDKHIKHTQTHAEKGHTYGAQCRPYYIIPKIFILGVGHKLFSIFGFRLCCDDDFWILELRSGAEILSLDNTLFILLSKLRDSM